MQSAWSSITASRLYFRSSWSHSSASSWFPPMMDQQGQTEPQVQPCLILQMPIWVHAWLMTIINLFIDHHKSSRYIYIYTTAVGNRVYPEQATGWADRSWVCHPCVPSSTLSGRGQIAQSSCPWTHREAPSLGSTWDRRHWEIIYIHIQIDLRFMPYLVIYVNYFVHVKSVKGLGGHSFLWSIQGFHHLLNGQLLFLETNHVELQVSDRLTGQ